MRVDRKFLGDGLMNHSVTVYADGRAFEGSSLEIALENAGDKIPEKVKENIRRNRTSQGNRSRKHDTGNNNDVSVIREYSA